MNLAILRYQDTDNPNGVPGEWPAQSEVVDEVHPFPGSPWIAMTDAELTAYCAARQALYTAWYQAFTAPPPEPVAEPMTGRRFDTHNLSDISDWDCRTHGRPLLTKLLPTHPTAFYDDVRYRVILPDETVLAQLDGVVETLLFNGAGFTPEYRLTPVAGGRKWRGANSDVLFEYQPDPAYPADRTKGGWVWLADSTVLTDSTWLIDPYDGTRMRLKVAVSGAEATASLQPGGAIVYQIKVANGVYIVGQYVYDTIDKLIQNADSGSGRQYQTASGATIQEHVYTYDEMEEIVIDSAIGATLEISLAGHLPILNTEKSYGAFRVQEFGVRT